MDPQVPHDSFGRGEGVGNLYFTRDDTVVEEILLGNDTSLFPSPTSFGRISREGDRIALEGFHPSSGVKKAYLDLEGLCFVDYSGEEVCVWL